MLTGANITGSRFKRIQKEVRELLNDPPAACKARLIDEDDMTAVEVTMTGPTGTPYSGGQFRISITMGPDYPTAQPPHCLFITKIFHPNVSPTTGEICVNTLKKDWNPQSMGLKHILLTIHCLLVAPNPESALNQEAGKLMLDCYDRFAQRAQQMTLIHASSPASQKSAPVSAVTMEISNSNNESISTGSNSNTVTGKPVVVLVETGDVERKKKKTLRRL